MRTKGVCVLGWAVFHQLLLVRAQTAPDNPIPLPKGPTPPDNPIPLPKDQSQSLLPAGKEILLVSPLLFIEVIAFCQRMLSP